MLCRTETESRVIISLRCHSQFSSHDIPSPKLHQYSHAPNLVAGDNNRNRVRTGAEATDDGATDGKKGDVKMYDLITPRGRKHQTLTDCQDSLKNVKSLSLDVHRGQPSSQGKLWLTYQIAQVEEFWPVYDINRARDLIGVMLTILIAWQVMTEEEYDPVLKQWNADEASITQAHESELAERKCK